jgi:transcriptional regulator with XRE-family HTH domain
MARTPRYKKELVAIGNRIEKLRVANDMSQRQLADAANISVSVLHGIEHAKRGANIVTLCAIADALEVSVKELV